MNKLVRPWDDRKIGGVCAGYAQWLEIDPTIVRLMFLIFLFAGGSAFFLYILSWIVIPNE